MMLPILAYAVLSTPIRYVIPVGTPLRIDVKVTFDGYLPVLGGVNGKTTVDLRVGVSGLPVDEKGNPQAVSEIEDMKISLNGGVLPLGPKNIAEFFPRTTISFSPEGRMLKTDAPDKKLPVQLPGLDAKRFPDITYLPIEFPTTGIEVGKAFTFQKDFGPHRAAYEVTPVSIDEDQITLNVKVQQSWTSWEDARKNPVAESEAKAELKANTAGKGTAVFDRKRGLVREAKIEADTATVVKDLATGAETRRDLNTTLEIGLRKA